MCCNTLAELCNEQMKREVNQQEQTLQADLLKGFAGGADFKVPACKNIIITVLFELIDCCKCSFLLTLIWHLIKAHLNRNWVWNLIIHQEAEAAPNTRRLKNPRAENKSL